MSGKNNAAKKNKNAETDTEKLDRYESVRSEGELNKFHLQKTVLFFIGTVMLVVAMFLPSDTSYHDAHKGFVGVFATVNAVAAIYALYMLFQENRKHKIRKTVLKKQAPRYGFDGKFTYLAYEIFCILTLVLFAEQCAIVAFARDGWAIAALCLMAACVACTVSARFILVKANRGFMKLIEVEKKDTEKDAEPNTETVNQEKTDKNSENIEPKMETGEGCDDFYAPPKE